MTWRCNICLVFVAISLKLLLTHIYSQHSQDPGFNILCGIDGCPRSYTRYNSFWCHVHKDHTGAANMDSAFVETRPRNRTTVKLPERNTHGDDDDVGEMDSGDIVDEVTQSPDDSNSTFTEEMKKNIVAYTINLREHHKVRESATNFIADQTNSIVKQYSDHLRRKIIDKLQCMGTNEEDIQQVDNIFEMSDLPFDTLQSAYERNRFIRSSYNVLEPEVITVGQETRILRCNGQRRITVKDVSFSYIPIADSLQQFLQRDEIADLVFNQPRSNNDGYYCDLCDGSVFSDHNIFNNENCLQLMLYFDDLEICNPLGKNSGTHKICAFYYAIANLPPIYRSRLPAIRLLALMKRKHMTKYGINKILNRIKVDLDSLAAGITIKVKGKDMILKGAIMEFIGDTLAAHEFCGFKVGVGFSFQKCRECFCTDANMQEKFNCRHFELRSLQRHDAQCREIDSANTKGFRNRLSTVYGINYRSAAFDFPGFDLLTMVPEDIMHVIFEGVALYEVKHCLVRLVEQGAFSLKQLNRILEYFSYGYKDKECQPSPIPEHIFHKDDTSLHQSASSMIVLLRLLPFFLIDKLQCNPECEIMSFLIELCVIIKFLIAPVVAHDTVVLLRIMIEDHLKKFKQLFPGKNIIPKQHYLIHLPSTIERYGPLQQVWSMRFEGKHQFLKQRMSGNNNYKNVVKSLTDRCLMYETSLNIGCQHSLISKDLVIGKCKSVSNLPDAKNQIHAFFGTNVNDIHSVYFVNWIQYHGQKFRKGESTVSFGENEGLPEFGVVKSIWISEESGQEADSKMQQVYFSLEMYQTLQYDEDLLAYQVDLPTMAQGLELVKIENLLTHIPLHLYESSDRKKYVFTPYDMFDLIQLEKEKRVN